MSRILFMGDLGATGFGSVTKDLGSALLALGEDVRFLSHYVHADVLEEPFGSRTLDITSFINVSSQLGGISGVTEREDDVIGAVLRGENKGKLANGEPAGDWKPDAAILLGDFTAARMLVMPNWAAFSTMRGRLFHYVPIEGIDLPPHLAQLWDLLTPVAMSNFGADELAKILGERPPVVYHGVDAETFHPVGERTPVTLTSAHGPPVELTSKQQCKVVWARFFGLKVPRRWILRCDANMPRKANNALLRAMAPVLHANPDTCLILHTPQFGQGGYLPDTLSKIPGARPLTNGMDADPPTPDAWALFGRPFPQVVLTNASGMARSALVTLYNAADLYVSTSAEGFGLTIAEAIACGVPAVGPDFSAVPEVIGPAGEVIPAYPLENMYDHFWCAIDEAKLSERVNELLKRPLRLEKMGRRGPPHVRDTFRWDTAARQFADLIHAAVREEEVAA